VTALSSTNAAVPAVVVTLAADTGVLSSQTVTTGTTGTATFTFSSGVGNLANRTATITATAGAATAQIPIQISGSTLSLFSTSGTSVPDDGTAPVSVTFISKNAQGVALQNTPYTVAWTTVGGGQLTLTPASGVTDANGKFAISVAGVKGGVGSATVTATAAGSTATATITVSLAAGTFAISQVKNNTTSVVTTSPTNVAMYTSDTLLVTVAAPAPTANVTFIATSGNWNGTVGQTSLVVPVTAGTASATLTAPPAGITDVQVNSDTTPIQSASLKVSVTAKVPNAITLQASPTLVSKSLGTSTGVSNLIATVTDSTGAPVGNAPVAFSITNTTGGGESVAPVVAFTASVASNGLALGQASATFNSGSLSSGSSGVNIRASVLGTTVATQPIGVANTTPSGLDAAVVVGGTAGSIAFGAATKIVELNVTTYQYPMSVLVSDVNGNPVANTVVTLSVWPAAWSTGQSCVPDYAGGPLGPNGPNDLKTGLGDTATTGTFYNEDANGNLILDVGEDGVRKYFVTGILVTGGAKDNALTPVNSTSGNLPATVTTDANGLANFNLTYLKSSALWVVDTIRASTVVQGSATVSQSTFRLPALAADVNPCYLGNSPFKF
jgi:hypothetical protein